MDCEDLLRRILKDMSRPERAVDARAQLLKFGGHAAIEDQFPFGNGSAISDGRTLGAGARQI